MLPRALPRPAAAAAPPRPRRGAAQPSRLPSAPSHPAARRKTSCRAGYNFTQSRADGTLTWLSGGGPWTPNGGGGGGGGGGRGGRGGGGPGGSSGDEARSSACFAAAAALFLLAAKSLVCWCSEDPKAAAAAIDLGFLTAMALLSWASLTPTPLAGMRLLLVQLTVAHIVLEMAFYGFLLNRIDPSAGYRMAPAMWVHHAAVAVGGLHTLALTAGLGGGVFLWVGAQLIITEITMCLPVAFHEALRTKRMRGPRSLLLGLLMPSAFVLRTVLSFRVLQNYLAVTAALTAGGVAVPLYWVSASTAAVIFGLNGYWTTKIFAGGAKAVAKQRRLRAGRGAAAEASLFDDAAGAAVYTELHEQKSRTPRALATARR